MAEGRSRLRACYSMYVSGMQCTSGIARSQTTPGHCIRLFAFFWGGGGRGGLRAGGSPSKFLHLRGTCSYSDSCAQYRFSLNAKILQTVRLRSLGNCIIANSYTTKVQYSTVFRTLTPRPRPEWVWLHHYYLLNSRK